MAKLLEKPCACIRRGDAHLPGTRGTLVIITRDKETVVKFCSYCGKP